MLTEIIDLPSKGNVYPEDNPLSSGKVELKYMTAKEEDILATESFIKKDIVTQKLLESVIVDKEIDPLDLLNGDSERLLLQTRILAYGSDYEFKHNKGKDDTVRVHVDLSQIEDTGKPELFDGNRMIEYKLDKLDKKIMIELPNGHDIKKIKAEIEALEKSESPYGLITTRLAHIIKSVEGNSDEAFIRDFVKSIPANDSFKLRMFIDLIAPDVDLTTMVGGEEVDIPMGVNFFYPTSRI